MIVGLGLDLAELDRIQAAWDRFGDRFLDRVLTPGERSSMPEHGLPFLAARFAAKEAASKALGTGFSKGVSMHTLEVVGGERGKPELALHGAARERARELGMKTAHISLTHGRDTASAVVILES
ncbi:holo-[acyl-carrier-protein] synthase [Desulfohalovibrio reitneri]|uniref:holo-[acyl-carrier-protein] synthase n=1 Tax=Desulfohalovibrio reitneri TaxID=1307759 RepID=UPI0004A6B415|nr:holo-[acyl-carrier-protein] synthase [Desulfohalovibrio reitneri]